jgi:hypothetical protein
VKGRRGEFMVMVGRPEGKRPLGKQGRRWEDIIKLDIQAAILGGGRVTGCFECGNEPSGSLKCGEFLE